MNKVGGYGQILPALYSWVDRANKYRSGCGSGGDAEADAGAGTPRDDLLVGRLAGSSASKAPRGEAHDEDFFSGSQSLGDAFQAK